MKIELEIEKNKMEYILKKEEKKKKNKKEEKKMEREMGKINVLERYIWAWLI